VEINSRASKYSVTLGNGLVIARDYTTFAPVRDNEYLVCSLKGGLIRYRIPDYWLEAARIKVFTIHEDGTLDQLICKIADKYIEFNAEPKVPYKVVYE